MPSSAPSTSAPHIPVMLNEVLAALAPKDGAIYVDGTFGAGGYSRAVLDAAACVVFAIDRDAEAVARGREMENEYKGRLSVLHGCFGDMEHLLAGQNITGVDGVMFDFGVSSMQLDTAGRGFSFQADGPLDMRMDNSEKNPGQSAADVVNTLEEGELASIVRELGEERHARRVARAIVEARSEAAITTTGQMADLVRGVVYKSKDGIDPATRTFQALRMYVNDELGEIDRGLVAAEAVLKPGGRLAVVAFHALEDRRVKAFLKERSGDLPGPSRHMPQPTEAPTPPTFNLLSRKATKPTEGEQHINPRSRSARLRAAERTDAPRWPRQDSGASS